jgi:hypothetical protein
MMTAKCLHPEIQWLYLAAEILWGLTLLLEGTLRDTQTRNTVVE